MHSLINNFPAICGNEKKVFKTIQERGSFLYALVSNININKIESSFSIVLHMHQPTIPAQGSDLRRAGLISNLQYMMEHQNIGDNHNAPIFLWCYSRMSDFIRELVREGRNPRVMLDYSGNLLWGLEEIDNGKVLENLKLIAQNKKYQRYAEWLGTMWSHAVISSTPIADIKLHILAWQQHFASIFGYEALSRVKGFSPPEMQLPIHPDICYEYVKALKECGYQWLMVQEHTVENVDGSKINKPHLPHKLVAKNSLGKIQEITVFIKTQGSDTKLVGQMQPYYEAKTLHREKYLNKNVPPFVVQISDGENGGVIMNEFPSAYKKAFAEISTEGTVSLNASEYLEFLIKMGIDEKDFIGVQPISQHKIWDNIDKYAQGAVDKAIDKIKSKEPHFNLEKASWTNDKNWVKYYEDVLDPINKLSAEFHMHFDKPDIDKSNSLYKEALLYLLLSQTSCFRYWGQGIWTDYAKEICQRGFEVIKKVR